MRANRILIIVILTTYASRFRTQTSLDYNQNNFLASSQLEASDDDFSSGTKHDPIFSSHGGGEKIPFGTSEFFLYVFYSSRKLISSVLHSGAYVRTHSRLLVN